MNDFIDQLDPAPQEVEFHENDKAVIIDQVYKQEPEIPAAAADEVGMEIEVAPALEDLEPYDPKSDLENYKYPTLDLLQKSENDDNSSVSMESIIKSTVFQDSKSELPCAIGKTDEGKVLLFNLTETPHLLVEGATGQELSVCLRTIITSLLYKKHPAEMKIVLIDPKMVEFSVYKTIERHFLAALPEEVDSPIITDTTKIVRTLNSLCVEMDARYELLMATGERNIKDYNKKFKERKLNPGMGHRYMPYIVVAINDFEGVEIGQAISHLVQRGHDVGIHLVIAIKHSTNNIITNIKGKIPARIELNSKGDIIFYDEHNSEHFQCATVSTSEIKHIIEYIASQQGYGGIYSLQELKSSKINTDETFLYLCFSQEDHTSVYPICKILDDKNVPYLLTPLSEYNGWDGIKEDLADIESAKQFLWVVSDNSHKDDYIADIIDYAKQVKNESEIIEYDLNSPKESIMDLCSIIEKRLGLDPEGLFTKANELNEIGNHDEAIKLYRKAANRDHSGAQTQIGICYYFGKGVVKNYDLAVSYFKKAAEQGEPTAQYYLGECYMNGDGLEKNDNKAFKYYQKASNQGNLDALTELGRCYYDGIWLGEEAPDGGFYMKYCQDYNKAVELFSKAAEQGHPKAQNSLGICYENGNGVKKDLGLAFKWYLKSAEQGNQIAQCNLGCCYEYGRGVKQNYSEAKKWYQKSADQGNARAQFCLGRCYQYGIGVEKIGYEAYYWYLESAKQGYSDGQLNLGWCLDTGYGTIESQSDAVEWYLKSAKQGNQTAQCNLGYCYEHGRGVKQNYSEAIKWYLEASSKGNKRANDNLHNMPNDIIFKEAYHLNHDNIDNSKAFKLYMIGAENEYAPALCNLGWTYSKGYGVIKDMSEANKWYRKAAEKGERVAQMNLADNLEKGNGINQDYSEAFKWYKKATTGTIGDQREMVARARYTVARYYENGLGIPKDINEAIIWYERAGSYKDAKERMEYLKKENSLTNKIFKLFK